jgi:MFS family permease
VDRNRLFVASCISMATTSMVFAVRGDIEASLGQKFSLTAEQIGYIWGPAFFGFTASVFVSGLIVDVVGMRKLFQLSGLGFLLGIMMIILAPGQAAPVRSVFDGTGSTLLYFGFLVMGLSQGLVEGVINPLITTLFKTQKTTKLNALHASWPAGLIIGGCVTLLLSRLGAPWQIKLAMIGLPTLTYMALAWNQSFPATERFQNAIPASTMVREAIRPLFLLLLVLMWGTAITELAADQWLPTIMRALTGLEGIIFLIYTAGIVFLMRTLVGRFVHRAPFLSQAISCGLCGAGLWTLGSLSEKSPLLLVFLAATLFGVGKSLLWPTMLGIAAERFPKGGALCISLVGGTGFLAIAVALPVIGHLLDHDGPGQALRALAIIPTSLVMIFGLLCVALERGIRRGHVGLRQEADLTLGSPTRL